MQPLSPARVRQIVILQRVLIACVPLLVLSTCLLGSIGTFVRDYGVTVGIALGGFPLLVTTIVVAAGVRIASLTHVPGWLTLLLGVGLAVPILNFALLAFINARAGGAITAAGLRIGVFGALPGELRNLRAGRCRQCGFDMTGNKDAVRCPECGLVAPLYWDDGPRL